MPQKSTATNLRRLFLNMQTQADNTKQRMIFSLAANKVFDSISWPYLWAILSKFGFGDRFISWVGYVSCMLHHRQQIEYLIDSHWLLPSAGELGKVVPLSPLLFAIVIEPLDTLLFNSYILPGFGIVNYTKKSWYMSFLGDTSSSLTSVMYIISEFGRFLGLTINWTKLALMLLDDAPGQAVSVPCFIPLVIFFQIYRYPNLPHYYGILPS